MRRRRTRTRRNTYDYPGDFGRALERFKESSGLTWAELARLLGTSTLNLWRWRNGVHPNGRHLLALQNLARSLGLEHLLPTASVRPPSQAAPSIHNPPPAGGYHR